MTIPRKALIPLILFLGLCCLGAKGGCKIETEPKPPATPEPTPGPPGRVCNPGEVCGCVHRPPGSDWIKLPDCPTAPACSIPDQGAVRVEPVPAPDPATFAAVNAAARKVAGCAEGPPSRCVVLRPMRDFLADVAAEIRAGGRCAGVQDAGHADEVCVETSPGRCQGYHAFACAADCSRGTVAWAPGSARDTWTGLVQGPTPEPPTGTPTPKPEGIPALSKIIVKSVGAGRPVADASPKTCPPEAERIWCTTHSTGGACCPGGGEHDPAGRQAVERAWGPYTWSINGRDCIASGECELDGGNPLRVVIPGGRGKTVRVTGGNGVFGQVTIP